MLTQWYEPEPGPAALPSVMARALARRGHQVHVVTGFPNYPSGSLSEGYRQMPRMREDIGGVHVIRVPLAVNHDRSSLRRVANYASFGMSAALLGVPSWPPLDVLWVNYSPITVALPMWLHQLVRRTPTVTEVADLWPDTVAVSGLRGAERVGRLGRGLLERWCDAMYESSDAVVHISPGVGEVLRARGVPAERLRYIPKPADEQAFHGSGRSMRPELGIPADAVVLVYAGTMGAAQDLASLIDACGLVDDPRLTVLFAGSGTHEAQLRRTAADRSLRAVRFLGRLPQERMADLLATADAGVVSLADQGLSAITMPSKTQAILASGRPVLAVATGDVATLVKSNGVGVTASPGDPDSIAGAIRCLLDAGPRPLAQMGRSARVLYDATFSVERTTDQIEGLLDDVARCPRRRRVPVGRRRAEAVS